MSGLHANFPNDYQAVSLFGSSETGINHHQPAFLSAFADPILKLGCPSKTPYDSGDRQSFSPGVPGVFSLGNPNHFSCGQLKMVLNHMEKPTVEPTITLISLMFKSCLSHV